MAAPTRTQLALYAVLVVTIVVLGGRALLAERAGPGAGGPTAFDAGRSPGTSGDIPAVEGTTGPAEAIPGKEGGEVAVDQEPSGPLFVHVAGAVRRPGLYRLRDGQRVADALQRAGGPTTRAAVDGINLAARVTDGQQVVVPRRGAGGSAAIGTASASAVAAPGEGVGAAPRGATPAVVLDLNTASLEELQTLDGVGPATAQKILDWRTQHGGFRSVDDLEQVPGIGPKKLAAMRPRVRV